MLDDHLNVDSGKPVARRKGDDSVAWRGLSVYAVDLELGGIPIAGEPGEPIRGLIGRSLFEQVCVYQEAGEDRCPKCSFAGACAFPKVFHPLEPDRLAPWWMHRVESKAGIVTCRLHLLAAALPALPEWIAGIAERVGRQGGKLMAFQDAASGRNLRSSTSLNIAALKFLAPATAAIAVTTPAGLVTRHAPERMLHSALHTRLQRLVNQYGDQSRMPIDVGWSVKSQEADRKPSGRTNRRAEVWWLTAELTDLTPAGRDMLAAGALLGAGGETASGRGRIQLRPR